VCFCYHVAGLLQSVVGLAFALTWAKSLIRDVHSVIIDPHPISLNATSSLMVTVDNLQKKDFGLQLVTSI
jgi:hypothetical protein